MLGWSKSSLGFSITSYRKIRTNVLAKLIDVLADLTLSCAHLHSRHAGWKLPICLISQFPLVQLCLTCNLHFHSSVAVVSSLSRVYSFATLWTVTCHAPLLMGFPRQEYRSGLPFPSPGDLPDPGIEPESPALAGRFFTTESSGKPTFPLYYFLNNSHCGCLQPCWAICLGGPNYLPSYQLLFFVCTLVIKFHRSEVIYAYGGFSHKLCFYSVIL